MGCTTGQPVAARISEKWLCAVWRRQRWRDGHRMMATGKALQIVYAGRHTFDHGPDFRDALLVFGDDLLCGDVEIHVRAGDWRSHGHQGDVYYNRVLLLLVLFTLHALLQQRRLERTIPAELLAFGSLALAGPGAYYASTGLLDPLAVKVWLLNFLYAGAGVFYVKFWVRRRVAKVSGAPSTRRLGLDMALYQAAVLFVLAFLATSGQLPLLALLAFLPLTVKVALALWHHPPEITLRRLGLLELGHSVAFATLLIAAYALR